MKNKLKKICTILIIMMICIVTVCYGHSGRTDSNGGHRDNKNSSGLGSYHYHCGGHPAHLHENGICPYDNNNSSINIDENTNIYNNSSNTTINSDVEVQEVKISNKNTIREVKLYSNFKINVLVEPYNSTNKELKYESSNPSVISISSDGQVKALKSGKSLITVTSNNGKKDEIEINVIVDPKEIKITNTNTRILLGESIELIANVLPKEANYKIEWTSGDEKILKVDENGKVSATGYGKATITAKVNNNVKDNITVTVERENNFISILIVICLFIGVVSVSYCSIKRKKITEKNAISNVDIKDK